MTAGKEADNPGENSKLSRETNLLENEDDGHLLSDDFNELDLLKDLSAFSAAHTQTGIEVTQQTN